MLTLRELRGELKRNRETILSLVTGMDEEGYRWKPDPEAWSVLEILNHLADEEAEDFRSALTMLLDNPDGAWPDIDPFGWVVSRGYNGREVAETIGRFREERDRTREQLGERNEPDPAVVHRGAHPFDTSMRVGDLMLSWAAHDYFHIRHLTERKWQWLMYRGLPYASDYAGPFNR